MRLRRVLRLEPLEARRLLASISGKVFHDFDGGGTLDQGEPGLSNVRVFIDADGDGQFTAGETSVFTDAGGNYSFDSLSAGTYAIGHTTPSGFTRTAPGGNGTHNVTVGASENVSGKHFGDKRTPIPFTPGNLLVSKGGFIGSDLLIEYTPGGEAIQALVIPGSEAFSRQIAKDLVVDRLGRVHLFNGYDDVRLTTLDPATLAFTNTNVPNWDMGRTFNHWGDIAALGDFLYANEHTDNTGAANGVIRFNITDMSFERFSTGFGAPTDLTIGLDGLLYTSVATLNSTEVRVSDPLTMQEVRTLNFDQRLYSIAVDASGNIFAATDTGAKRFDPTGAFVSGTPAVAGSHVDISPDGQSLAFSGDPNLGVTVTTPAFDNIVSFALPNQLSGFAFVTFIPDNEPPTISDIPDQVTEEDVSTGAIPFTVGDRETPMGSLVVTAASSNQGLVPNASLVLGGSGADRTLTITPAANQSGVATITVTVDDGLTTASDTFLLTVNPVNDAPTISPIANLTIDEDTVGGPIAFTIGDVDSALGSLTVTAASSNQALVPDADLVLGGSGANRTLTITPAPNAFGASTITVSVSDGLLTTTETFLLTVVPVNDAPTISAIADVTIDEDASTEAIAFTIGDVETPAANLTVTASSSNTALVDAAGLVLGGSGADRTLTITPNPDQFGAATISVTVSDGSALTTETFLLTVNPVNDAPTITPIGDQATDEDVPIAIPFSISDLETLADDLTITVESSNADLAPHASFILGGNGANRVLTITPAENASGTAEITVTVSDGSLSAASTFVLAVQPVNDAPTISELADLEIDEDSDSGAIPFTIGDAETSADELTVTVASSDETLIPTAGLVLGGAGANRTLTVTSAADQFGEATITVTVGDGDASTSETFVLTVRPINDAPTISAIADQATDEDVSTGEIVFTIDDLETSAGDLTVTASSSNAALVPDANLVFGGSGAARTLTITPAADASGTAVITVTVSDGSLTAATTFVLTVQPINDAPTISPIGDRVTDEDVPLEIEFTLGDLETSAEDLVVTVSSSDASVVPDANLVLAGAGAARTLTIMPAADASGTAVIRVTVSDGSLSTTETFLLTVAPVNDAPTEITLDNSAVDENAPGAVIGELAALDPEADDTHTWSVSDDRFEIVGGVLKLKEGVALNYEAEPTVTLDITATDSGEPPQSLTRQFVITVLDVEEPAHPWHNAAFRWDVDGNGRVELLDVVELVGFIRAHGNGAELPTDFPPGEGPPILVDVDADGRVTLGDILEVILRIREDRLEDGSQGEGEPESAAPSRVFDPWSVSGNAPAPPKGEPSAVPARADEAPRRLGSALFPVRASLPVSHDGLDRPADDDTSSDGWEEALDVIAADVTLAEKLS